MIAGTRGDVRGKPGVIVTGSTTGITPGTRLAPWFRFPGQLRYEQGTTRPAVQTDGAFTWQRRTGKKIYISLRTADGFLRSNRLVIS